METLTMETLTMETLSIVFPLTYSERDLGRGFQPYQLNSGIYDVSNLVMVGNTISFDLYEGEVWKGMYIVKNVVFHHMITHMDGRWYMGFIKQY